MTPEILDLYSGTGGATRGYQQAGFRVTGVDIAPMSSFCGDEFLQADALDHLRELITSGEIRRYTAVHASPPCQAGCTLTNGTNHSRGWGRTHVQLVPQTRELLQQTGLPFVIEQPTGHGGLIRTDLRLCMDMFRTGPPPWVQRHRDFELSGLAVPQPAHPSGAWNRHDGYVRGHRHRLVRSGAEAPYVAAYGKGGGKATVPEMQHALGIDWTNERGELTEAIPPAYTRYIGGYLLKTVSPGPGLAGADVQDTATESGSDVSNVDTVMSDAEHLHDIMHCGRVWV